MHLLRSETTDAPVACDSLGCLSLLPLSLLEINCRIGYSVRHKAVYRTNSPVKVEPEKRWIIVTLKV